MDAILEDHLSRVETALNALLDSITLYNPSPAAAGDLLAADEGLSGQLRVCECGRVKGELMEAAGASKKKGVDYS